MKKVIFYFYLCSVSYLGIGQNYEKNYIDENYIEVIGEAEKEISPNEIYLKVIISESDNKGKESLEELELKLFNALESIGVDLEKDLTIIDFASNFKFYLLKKTKILVKKEYQILARNTSVIEKIFLELEKINISNISIDRIAHSGIKQFEREVKIEAINVAKEKATFLAESIGQKIGKAIYISEFENNINNYEELLSGRLSGVSIRGSRSYFYKKEGEKPMIEFEKIKIGYKIAVKFKLE